ncbi:MAG: hypothetical protein U9O87_09095 [Verrucomicrobiota bacterium]|nr:hypothetical protein [Verrucomicrobiota bacterium]
MRRSIRNLTVVSLLVALFLGIAINVNAQEQDKNSVKKLKKTKIEKMIEQAKDAIRVALKNAKKKKIGKELKEQHGGGVAQVIEKILVKVERDLKADPSFTGDVDTVLNDIRTDVVSGDASIIRVLGNPNKAFEVLKEKTDSETSDN